MTSTALAATDSLATTIIHKLPAAAGPAFQATCSYYIARAQLNVGTPLLILLILALVRADMLKQQDRKIAAADSGWEKREHEANRSVVYWIGMLVLLGLGVIVAINLPAAILFLTNPQVATVLALAGR